MPGFLWFVLVMTCMACAVSILLSVCHVAVDRYKILWTMNPMKARFFQRGPVLLASIALLILALSVVLTAA